MMDLDWLWAIAMVLFALLWVKLVRDIDRILAHHWQPLYRLHVWHHRVFRPDFSVTSETNYQRTYWYNDLPESLVMLVLSGLPIVIFWSLHVLLTNPRQRRISLRVEFTKKSTFAYILSLVF